MTEEPALRLWKELAELKRDLRRHKSGFTVRRDLELRRLSCDGVRLFFNSYPPTTLITLYYGKETERGYVYPIKVGLAFCGCGRRADPPRLFAPLSSRLSPLPGASRRRLIASPAFRSRSRLASSHKALKCLYTQRYERFSRHIFGCPAGGRALGDGRTQSGTAVRTAVAPVRSRRRARRRDPSRGFMSPTALENGGGTMERPWYAAILAKTPERARVPTALEDALFNAVEKALYDPRHALHRQTFGYYRGHAPEGCKPASSVKERVGQS